ncbi:MAG: hypothetical protein EXX96DRAFT_144537 [Benjaminiella poitrasii]|nr:MAG: hypothetical protein EXX96DRAFT_144537 [Benjaminiella poitrasii]
MDVVAITRQCTTTRKISLCTALKSCQKTNGQYKAAALFKTDILWKNKSRPNWEKIAFIIHDKRLGIVPPHIDPSINFYNRVSETQHTSVTTEYADSFTETTSTSSSTNTSKKQIKLRIWCSINAGNYL